MLSIISIITRTNTTTTTMINSFTTATTITTSIFKFFKYQKITTNITNNITTIIPTYRPTYLHPPSGYHLPIPSYLHTLSPTLSYPPTYLPTSVVAGGPIIGLTEVGAKPSWESIAITNAIYGDSKNTTKKQQKSHKKDERKMRN